MWAIAGQNTAKIGARFRALRGRKPPRKRPVESRDRVLLRAGDDVHVAHRRREVPMAGELLDDRGRLPRHREPRAEGVAEDVHVPGRLEPSLALRVLHQGAHPLGGEPGSVVVEEEDLPVVAENPIARKDLELRRVRQVRSGPC